MKRNIKLTGGIFAFTMRTANLTPRKKTPERKRTPFPREVLYTKDFADDWEKLERSGKHDMNRSSNIGTHSEIFG